MHTLTRQVRFSINPFLPHQPPRLAPRGGAAGENEGFNPYASKPVGEGLSVFLELSVELAGNVEPATGFVVNVTDIDSKVREFGIPIFARRVRADFQQGKSVALSAVAEMLRSVWDQLADKFVPAAVLRQEDAGVRLNKLSLKLNPFRELAVDCEEPAMIYFSEKFAFAAGHKLWNDQFSQQRNVEIFGKCANPSGHGHNYVVEVTIKKPTDGGDFCIGDFERIVDDQLIKVLDHKNLNVDVAEFAATIPTVENIAAFAWNRLVGKFSGATLACVTVWETDKTRCSYFE
jgi:6-pyruvoyltetrahydropterin/6-carboxytetrahydropterin synthase